MNTRKKNLLMNVLLLLFTALAGQPASSTPRGVQSCNTDVTATGASSVVRLQGQGNFSCSNIYGSDKACLNAACTMAPAPGFTSVINPDTSVSWTASRQVDKIFVSGKGQGSRCLYEFPLGTTRGNYQALVTGASTPPPTVTACYDGYDTPPVKAPISTTTNCAAALPQLQNALNNDPNMLAVIGIGSDQGLNGQGTTDGSYAVAVCAANGQVECVDQCRNPTAKTYSCSPNSTSEQCLNTRACATSDETPTGNAGAPKYCWELSHSVNLTNGTFVPVTELESGSASWEQYHGSTCIKVTTTLGGKSYTYYSPTGCPTR